MLKKPELSKKRAPQRLQATLTQLPSKLSPSTSSSSDQGILLSESSKAQFISRDTVDREGAQVEAKSNEWKDMRYGMPSDCNQKTSRHPSNIKLICCYSSHVVVYNGGIENSPAWQHPAGLSRCSLLPMNSLSFRLYLYSGQLRPHPISGCPISNHLPLIFLGVCCTISYSQSPQDRGYWNEQTFFSIRHDDKDDDGDKISTRVTEACSRMNEKSSDWQVVWGKIPPSFIKSYPHVDKALSLYSSRDELDRWPGILTYRDEVDDLKLLKRLRRVTTSRGEICKYNSVHLLLALLTQKYDKKDLRPSIPVWRRGNL